MSKKVVWFSRHKLNDDQEKGLKEIYGDIEIFQCNATVADSVEYFDLIEKTTGLEMGDINVHAVVAPIELVQDIKWAIQLAGRETPVIFCKSKRLLTKEGKVSFAFDGWFEYEIVRIKTKKLGGKKNVK